MQNVVNSSTTLSTTPTAISATSSTLGAMHAQLSSIERKNEKSMKLTVQHLIIDYPTIVCAAHKKDAMLAQHLLH